MSDAEQIAAEALVPIYGRARHATRQHEAKIVVAALSEAGLLVDPDAPMVPRAALEIMERSRDALKAECDSLAAQLAKVEAAALAVVEAQHDTVLTLSATRRLAAALLPPGEQQPPLTDAQRERFEAAAARGLAANREKHEGEIARMWVGAHFHELKDAIAATLTGARVGTETVSIERAKQFATLAMAAMSHVYPDAPWAGEIAEAIGTFAAPVPPGEQQPAAPPDLLKLCDREPQPSDGPDYYADHAAWRERNGR